MWRAVLALALVGLAAGAALWMSRTAAREGSRPRPSEPAQVEIAEPPAALASLPEAEALEREPAIEGAASAPLLRMEPEEAPAPTAAEPGGIPLSGTIVVVDPEGLRHAAEDGSFVLFLWRGDLGEGQEVSVEDGRWSTEVPGEPPVESLSVGAIQLGERGAVWEHEGAERFPVPPSGWLELHARWPPGSTLRVRDRRSGRELAPVLAVEVGGWPESELGHPGSAAAEARDLGPSPVTLPPSDFDMGQRAYHVRSPGYAWSRIEIDETRGGERIVLLDPAGALEVLLAGAATDPGTKLRLFGNGYAPVFEQGLLGATSVSIEDLAPGSLRVVAQIGDYWDDPLELGETAAEVVAGRRTRVSLALVPPAERIEVPLAGTLALPVEWELADFGLDFELLDTPLGGWDGRFSIEASSMSAEGAGSYRWSAGTVQPGRYEVELDALAFSLVLDVGPAGLTDARLEVPPPGEVLVRCLDEENELEVTSERVSWHCVLPAGVNAWSSAEAVWEDARRCWRFRAPLGRVLLQTRGQAYLDRWEEVEVRAGTNEVVLRLARLAGLTLVLRDGATEVPWSDAMEATLVPLEGQEDHRSSTWGNGTFTFRKKAPGAYELRVEPIDGYEPIPATVVRIEKGVVARHVIELVRRP